MKYSATPTIGQFMQSKEFVCLLMGPRREGKTTGGIYKPLYVARQGIPKDRLPLRGIVVRDTWVRLQQTTMDNIHQEARKGLRVKWMNQDRECILEDNEVHLYFLGVENSDDINKLQGMGAAFLWLEDPAPAADISGGIPPEVFGMGVTSLSQPGVPHWVQITMNPPDEDHWIMNVAQMLPQLMGEKYRDQFKVKYFRIPPGERVPEAERERNRAALMAIGRGDLVQRLVEGRVGQIVQGEPVTPDFNELLHVAKMPLPILQNVDIIRMWDFGLHPCIVWSQVTPRGHWNILAAHVGENIGLTQLIDNFVKPWESEYLIKGHNKFRDIHDPSGTMREQSDSNTSAITTMVEMLDANPEPGPVEWATRRDSMNALLSRQSRGVGIFQVDPDCKLVIRTLRGGAHYPKDGLGRITATVEAMKRASGLYHNVLDCLCYGAAVLFPIHDQLLRALGRTPKVPQKVKPLGRHSWMGA